MLDDAALAAHPQASAADLARIVTQRPDLRPVVAGNPAAQPGLLDWLAVLGDPAVDAALARRVSFTTPASVPGAVFHPDGVPARPAQAVGLVGVALDEHLATPQVPGRSRRGRWIGIAVAVALVVGLGAGAAWMLVLSKLGGASTPEAAVTQLIEGAAAKDGVAVYGSLSPAEVSTFADLVEPFSELSGVTGREVSAQKLLGVLDAIDVDLSGLRVRSESIGDGLAKVTIVGGTLTVDGDGAAIADALADVYGPLATAGLSAQEAEAGWADAAREIDGKLPWTITADDLRWHSSQGDQEPFLVAVREGGSWYVSPLMTIGEYATVDQGAARGAMPTGEGTAAGTPEAAGEEFVRSFTDATRGDLSRLADVLPPAERRFVTVYGQAWADQEQTNELDVRTVEEARFTSSSIDGDHARLVAAPVVVTTPATDRDPVRTTIEGTCITQDDGPRECVADQPFVRQLGLDDAGLVAVRDDGGWRISILATTADISRIVAQHVRDLEATGDLDDGELLQRLWADAFTEQLGGAQDPAAPPGADDSAWPLPETDDGDGLDSDLLEPDPWAGSGYSFDSDGVLHGPDGEEVENWSMRDDGSLLDEDGTVLAGP